MVADIVDDFDFQTLYWGPKLPGAKNGKNGINYDALLGALGIKDK
jgi:hypothetical protein